MKGSFGKLPHSFTLDDHGIKTRILNGSTKGSAEAISSAGDALNQRGAEETGVSKLRAVIQMLDYMKMHWNYNFFPRFSLVINDDTLFREHVVPLHVDA